ncbi:SHOCT domain-containing protein [Streptacidiphilus jiangxiensis]|uniref:Short C-terminal domain-containing protein n=1 Tax=Streptacidiphilus jiangxiensis TaxID=235985 RepID=A0A1H7ZY97_STRJI|nr:SHOCT domain-containing protein [Streptacidiphilus jiangxiensis]SEM63632.1 Short C-terminal domain-containing protein [Streptacidiphilus jiangxiensis]
MTDDPVQSLERLAELHRRGDLSDTEFEDAKRQLLQRGSAGGAPVQPTVPAPAMFDTRPPFPQQRESQEAPGPARMSAAKRWTLALIATVVVGFVLGIALLVVAEVAPSTAGWTTQFVCAGGQHLITNGGVVHSNGGSAQGSTHFYCAPVGQQVTGLDLLSMQEQSGNVLGLSMLLGFLIAAVLVGLATALLALRSKARVPRG